MFPAAAGFKFKGNSAGKRNWTAVRLPVRAIPQEYIEYFEDSADDCAQALEKRHFVRNLSLTQ